MKELSIPRVMIAGTSSGCGKTTLTCAILGGLIKKNINPASFKTGPDYIDPMFHSKILGVNSSNLDAYFCDDDTLKSVLAENSKSADISVIEGVMGFYDGIAIDSDFSSSYHLSNITNTPVILALNCKGAANSIMAVIKGFLEYTDKNNIKAVILNNITEHTYKALKKAIEIKFNNEITVVGYLPKLTSDLTIESRHLGLVTADEIKDINHKLDKISEIALETINFDEIISLANSATDIRYNQAKVEKICNGVNIAVAYDKAFCFYYKDTFELFKKLGANIVFFSPLEDEKLPSDIHGLYLGGGYPELYKEKLSQNIQMKNTIKSLLEDNVPCIAECGGYMYLTDEIEGESMVGAIKTNCFNKNKLTRFGYVELTANVDNLLCKKDENFKGHEFHYYDTADNGNSFKAEKYSKLSWQAAHTSEYLYAGFPHISFLSNINIAKNFINKCSERKK